jgi:hypothetical protein
MQPCRSLNGGCRVTWGHEPGTRIIVSFDEAAELLRPQAKVKDRLVPCWRLVRAISEDRFEIQCLMRYGLGRPLARSTVAKMLRKGLQMKLF